MEALKLFQEYMGTGLIMIWFLISLLYLWLTEKRKHIRVMFLYVPLVLLFVFFNPLVAKLVSGLADGEIYYRSVAVAGDSGDRLYDGGFLQQTCRI